MPSDDSYSERAAARSEEQPEAPGGPPNEGAPGHEIDPDAVAATTGERDAGRPNEGAPGHEPDD